jgi:iron complex outermembrane recepter protein
MFTPGVTGTAKRGRDILSVQGPGTFKRGRAWLLSGTAFLCLSLLASPSALAQEANAVAADAGIGNDTTLEPIIIDARRYGERVIEVPVAVTPVTADEIASERISEVQDLSGHVVGLQMPNYGDDPRTAQPIVRGVGTLSTMLSPDNSTAPTIVDGVPLPAFGGTGQLFDVGQIEVLRGPQGTLYGRNSTGGAINIKSELPSDETIRQITTEIGTDGYRKGEFILGGAINEELSGRFAARYLHRGGYVDNDHPGQDDIGGFGLGAFKGQLLWTPGDSTEIHFSTGYDRYSGDTGYPYLLRGSNAYQETPEFKRDLSYTTLNISHEFDTFALKTTTGFTYYDIYNWTDNSDGYVNSATYGAFGFPTPATFYTYDGDVNVTDQRESQFYQEVRLQSLDDADTRWVVGSVLSYNNFTENVTGTSSTAASVNGTRDVNLTSTSAAIFADIAQPFAERFEIGGGLRYTYERKGIDALYTGNGFPDTEASYSQDDSRDFNMLSGRISLSYEPTEDSLIYGTISRGSKAGGYPRFTGNATIGVPERGYDETSIWAYEIGYKADFAETGTSFRVAGFFNDVKDEAIFGYNAATATFPIENFGLQTYGGELEVRQELFSGLNLSSGLTLTGSQITEIPVDGVLAAEVGNRVPNVPLWSLIASLSYVTDLDLAAFEDTAQLSTYLGYRYVGKREGDTANAFELDAQHVVDARVGLKVKATEFYVFGENLIGDLLEQQGAFMATGVESVVVSRGRTIGVGMTVKF